MILINLSIRSAFSLSWAFVFALSSLSCKEKTTKEAPSQETAVLTAPNFKLSLAQWSIHKMINEGSLDPYAFAEKAHDWGFEGLEYVSQLYNKELQPTNYGPEAMANFVAKSLAESEKYGMQNLLIMIDGQGNLATTDAAERQAAVENHYKWVDAAAALGCHSVRVNLAGSNDPEVWIPAATDGLSKLATYAATKNINVIVENHGGLSSNAGLLVQVMEAVNMDNAGTLPDFGNFCIAAEWGASGRTCSDEYDRYKGIEEMMPYAKAVSAKSHDFGPDGQEIHSDYPRIMKLVKDAGYNGFVGVEYEGSILSEEAGIIATRDLLISLQ
ncbi:MAG: sugar phosphate isomerase/epimerase [Bacteroidetes bacterium]|nr:sugar phosphate isomerase/epimerase [Bacteroidota bacterium]